MPAYGAVLAAKAVVTLCLPGTEWVTGNVINVDDGEDVVA
jgi:hypothetical protein